MKCLIVSVVVLEIVALWIMFLMFDAQKTCELTHSRDVCWTSLNP